MSPLQYEVVHERSSARMLTATDLMVAGACSSGVTAFMEVFPHGVVVDAIALEEAAKNADLDLGWLVEVLAGGPGPQVRPHTFNSISM